jgi:hypothetical protein
MDLDGQALCLGGRGGAGQTMSVGGWRNGQKVERRECVGRISEAVVEGGREREERERERGEREEERVREGEREGG